MADARGLYPRYRVDRLDGSSRKRGKHAACDYFVLYLNHDKFARAAILAYAEACEQEFPALAGDLREKVRRG